MEAIIGSYINHNQGLMFSQCTTKTEMVIVDVLDKKQVSTEFVEPVNDDLPVELEHISRAIVNGRYILDLDDNWDDNGAIKVPKIIFDRAMTFLKNYSSRTFDVFGRVIKEPDIQPLSDGSIDLEWKTDNANLLVNIKNSSENIAYYYGETLNSDYDTNGKISTNVIEDTFAAWLKHLS